MKYLALCVYLSHSLFRKKRAKVDWWFNSLLRNSDVLIITAVCLTFLGVTSMRSTRTYLALKLRFSVIHQYHCKWNIILWLGGVVCPSTQWRMDSPIELQDLELNCLSLNLSYLLLGVYDPVCDIKNLVVSPDINFIKS